MMLALLFVTIALAVSGVSAASSRVRLSSAACRFGHVKCCNNFAHGGDSAHYAATMQNLNDMGLLSGLESHLVGVLSPLGTGDVISVQGNPMPMALGCYGGKTLPHGGPGATCEHRTFCCDYVNTAGSVGLNCVPIDV